MACGKNVEAVRGVVVNLESCDPEAPTIDATLDARIRTTRFGVSESGELGG